MINGALRGLFTILFILLIPIYLIAETSDSAIPVLKIGFIGPLTGNAAVLGIDALPAIQIAIEEENKAGDIVLKLLIEDDQYQTAKTLPAYKRLVNFEKVDLLFMLTYGALFALKNQVQNDQILVLDTLDCNEPIAELPENFICIAPKTEGLGILAANHVLNNQGSPVGIIYYGNDPFMEIVSSAAKNRIEDGGGKVVLFESYPADTTDFRSILLGAKQRKVNSLFLYGYYELSNAMSQARNMGMKQQFYALNTVNSPGFRKAAAKADEGTILSSYLAPRSNEFQKFLLAFKEKTGRDAPDLRSQLFLLTMRSG